MTVDQALALVGERRKTMAIDDRHRHDMVRPVPTRAEVTAAILRKLRLVEARIAREKATGDQVEDARGGAVRAIE